MILEITGMARVKRFQPALVTSTRFLFNFIHFELITADQIKNIAVEEPQRCSYFESVQF